MTFAKFQDYIFRGYNFTGGGVEFFNFFPYRFSYSPYNSAALQPTALPVIILGAQTKCCYRLHALANVPYGGPAVATPSTSRSLFAYGYQAHSLLRASNAD